MRLLIPFLTISIASAQAIQGRINYNKMASDAITLAEEMAISDEKCPVKEEDFKTTFFEPNLTRYDFEHILYRNGKPYAGFKENGFEYSYHQAFSGQWEYAANVVPGDFVSFQKFRNLSSELIVSGNQTVARMDDFLYGTNRLYRVFCASGEEFKRDGFGHPIVTRYTRQIIQTPFPNKAKAALKSCVLRWFVRPMKRDFCKPL